MDKAVRNQKLSGSRVFAEWWSCPKCQGKVDKTDRFCRSCGVEMLSSPPPRHG
jgi:predicted amidophosphoribosyltransferase